MRTFSKVSVVAAVVLLASSGASAATLNSAFANVTCAQPYTFSQNIGLGARGTEVMNLQKVLNLSPLTQVASIGAGSPGSETMLFGPATRAALVKFQRLHPADTRATGFNGPLTRSLLNLVCAEATTPSNLPAGCSSTSGFSPVTGQSCSTGQTNPGTGTTVSGSGLQVMASANNGGTIIAGAAQVPVLNFRVMNPSNGEVTVNSLKFMKLGTVSDASIVNGYLSSGNQIVGQYTSLSQGVMTFANVNAKIPAGASVDMSLRVDTSASLTAGNLLGFQIMSANDVVISAGSVGGTFPMVGANFYTTSVTNPSLASVSSNYQTVGSSVDAGTMSFRAGAVVLNVVNNPVRLQSVRFNVNGSINPSADLANIKLRVAGQEVATGMVSGNSVYFDLGSSSRILNTGSQLLEVYADVLGTPNRKFRMEILRPYDVMLVDTQYNTNISFPTPTGSATEVEVRKGTATVSRASDSPTGTIPLGGSNVTLAKFRVFAAGEALRIKFLPFTLTKTGGTAWNVSNAVDAQIRNIGLFGDDGVQVGTTINTPSGCSSQTPVIAANSYGCSFGSASSNINYTIPANTTRVLSLRADIQNAANFTSIIAQLDGVNTLNVEGQISFQTSNLPGTAVSGSNLSLTTAPFQATLNGSLGSQTIVGGANNQRIASFSLSASSAEGVNVNTIQIRTAGNAGSNQNFALNNLVVKVDGNSWTPTFGSVERDTTFGFNSSSGQLQIPAGGSKTVDVFADVGTQSVAGSYNPVILVDASGNGAVTGSTQTLRNQAGQVVSVPANNITGQTVTVAGAGTANVTVDSSIPPAQQLVLGATGATLGQFRLTASNNEDVRVDQVTVTIESGSGTGPATFKNLRLFDGNTEIAMGTAVSGSTPTFTSLFTIPNGGILIAKNGTKTLTVKGDVSDFNESPLSNNQAYTIRIAAASDIRAFGQASGATITPAGVFPLISNAQTALRTKVTATLASMGSTQSRARGAADDVARITLNADSAYNAEFRGVTLTLSGAALFAGQQIDLVDEATGIVVATGVTGGTVNLNPATPEFITASGSKVYRVRVNSGSFLNQANTSDSFSIQIANASDLRVREQGGASNFGLETRAVPLTTTVSYE